MMGAARAGLRAPVLLLLVATLACLVAHTHAVDCRKFVFAPVCRGIIAKRMVAEKRSPFRPAGDTQWKEHYHAPTETDTDGLLLASYDDVVDPRPQDDMVVVRAGGDEVQVPAYVYQVIERSLQGEKK
ncbi:uncharacterized protein [Procambarus clarkii]|uniref:uncharacterized protein n=1 Tax=Procambarus clarkii TaxID=6728 RepID=UPI001E6785E6|nr:uncharacterized protein LOC123770419 [Procambarus clarkii]